MRADIWIKDLIPISKTSYGSSAEYYAGHGYLVEIPAAQTSIRSVFREKIDFQTGSAEILLPDAGVVCNELRHSSGSSPSCRKS
ncbi:hypothetical protein TNCV_3882671 [Trichonephila clavipes]|nr:hypothetical protein TNCV_3882671 [Trichonephila clavipes]